MAEPSAVAIPVLVTGVGGGGIGEQILKALRLASTTYDVIGTEVVRHSAGFANVNHRYVVPRAQDSRFIDALRTICERHGVRAIFPGSESELRVLARHRSAFEAAGILVPVSPEAVLETCLNKDSTIRFLESRGFAAPRTFRVEREQDIAVITTFPVVLKPYVGGGGSADVWIAQDTEELLAFARHLIAGGRRLIVQEYVGSPDREFTVGVLLSMDGEIINSIALRRRLDSVMSVRVRVPNRTSRHDLGEMLVISSGISQGDIAPFPEITKPCEAVALALGARGPINVQCRQIGDRIVIFEINPRFSGTTSLRAMVGYNEPDVLVREHVYAERTPRRFSFSSAVILRGLSETMISPKATAEPVEVT
jgi:carbamoyl-phosphate synthase large subunit